MDCFLCSATAPGLKSRVPRDNCPSSPVGRKTHASREGCLKVAPGFNPGDIGGPEFRLPPE
jgi:hypothetical protein